MATYIVSYDLRNLKDYQSLYDAIKAYGTYAKILESVWAICTESTAKAIRDNIGQYIDNDDGLFVIKSGQEAAWRKVNCTDKWLRDNL